MDNPIAESNRDADAYLNVSDAAELFRRRISDESGDESADWADGNEEHFTESAAPEVDEESSLEEINPDTAPRFKVKVDGQEMEVSQDELLNGYSRQQDYTKKTMELAEQRKQIEQAAAYVMAEREQYQNQLAQMAQALGQSLDEQQQIDWQQLLDNDPMEYLKQRHLYEQRQAALGQARVEQQRLAEQAQRENAMQMQTRLQEEQQALLAKLPEWKDAAKAKAEIIQVRQFLENMGYQPDEIDQAADHRAILLARKAMLYDQLMAQHRGASKRVEKLPARVERPGVSGSTSADSRKAAMQRLSRSGKVEDAAAVFASLLG